MQTIHLEPKQVPPTLRGSYDGRKFKAQVVEAMTVPADAGLWSGGSRELYSLVELNSGVKHKIPGQDLNPWEYGEGARQERRIPLKQGFAVVRHSIFAGKDMGLTFYVHPDNAAALLPPPVEISPTQRLVLKYTGGRKSSYMGRDRYQMAVEDWRYYGKDWNLDSMPTREQWDEAKIELIASGFLNKAGAITTKGRNAVGGLQ